MTAISPSQLDVVAAFLETSREYLDIEHPIRLHWPCQFAYGATSHGVARMQAGLTRLGDGSGRWPARLSPRAEAGVRKSSRAAPMRPARST